MGVLGNLLASEIYDHLPRLSERLVRHHASRLSPELRERMQEEWLASLHEISGKISGFVFALDLFRARVLVNVELRKSKREIERINKIQTAKADEPRIAANGKRIHPGRSLYTFIITLNTTSRLSKIKLSVRVRYVLGAIGVVSFFIAISLAFSYVKLALGIDAGVLR
jgi:hypothetical protein